MTQRIRNVATYIIPLLMCVCVLGMTRWALLQEHQLLEQSSNKGVSGEEIPSTLRRRLQLQLAAKNRGSILDRTGYILASTSNGIRQYADEYSSHVVGYVSHNGIGQVGLEATQEQQLLGSQKWQNDWLELINQPTYGQDIQLTINHRLQAEIATTLNGRAGAAVVINANDGAVYGIISSPTYDTNQFLNDPTYSPTLQDDQSQFNRAVEGLYTPGSTWKTISLIAALDSGLLSADHLFEFGEPHYDEEGLYYTCTFEDKSIIDRNHTEAQLTLADAFALSANCAFAEIGASLAPETLTHYAKQFGFSTEEAIPFELLAPSGLLAHDLTLLESEFQRAQTAFGQGQLLASPLHMALVAASVANGGHLPAPHLVQATHSNRNIFADIHSNHYWRRKVMN
ncbi:MAG: penicillin-binding transpeptidase domain-containing protein, partial [Candidatus Promineifilaceae bacterium]